MDTKTFEDSVLNLVDGMVSGADATPLYDIHSSLERIADEVRERAELEETFGQGNTTEGWDKRHGGPYDRGSADSYYRRSFKPHYYVSGTGTSPEVTKDQMTEAEIAAYTAGFKYNEEAGTFKDY